MLTVRRRDEFGLLRTVAFVVVFSSTAYGVTPQDHTETFPQAAQQIIMKAVESNNLLEIRHLLWEAETLLHRDKIGNYVYPPTFKEAIVSAIDKLLTIDSWQGLPQVQNLSEVTDRVELAAWFAQFGNIKPDEERTQAVMRAGWHLHVRQRLKEAEEFSKHSPWDTLHIIHWWNEANKAIQRYDFADLREVLHSMESKITPRLIEYKLNQVQQQIDDDTVEHPSFNLLEAAHELALRQGTNLDKDKVSTIMNAAADKFFRLNPKLNKSARKAYLRWSKETYNTLTQSNVRRRAKGKN